jgi:hypothetical protein
MKLRKKILLSFLYFTFISVFFQFNIYAADAKQQTFKSLNVQINTQLKNKNPDMKKVYNLIGQVIVNAMPKNYSKLYNYTVDDIDKDNIPELFIIYSNSQKYKMNFTVMKWDKKLSTYVNKFSKNIDNVTQASVLATNSIIPNARQYFFSYSVPSKYSATMILQYKNGNYKLVYSFKGFYVDIYDLNKDKVQEIGEVTKIPNTKDKLKRVWRKWVGNNFKAITSQTMTQKQLVEELNKRIKDSQAQIKKAQDQYIATGIKAILNNLKPKEYKGVDGYLAADIDKDKLEELIGVYKKDDTSNTYKIEFYKVKTDKSGFTSIFSKEFNAQKVVDLNYYDYYKDGKSKAVLTFTTQDGKQNVIVYSYENGNVVEKIIDKAK